MSFYQNIKVESLCNIYKSRKPLLCALEFGLFKYFWPVRVYKLLVDARLTIICKYTSDTDLKFAIK